MTEPPLTFTFTERVNKLYCDKMAFMSLSQFSEIYKSMPAKQDPDDDMSSIAELYTSITQYCRDQMANNYVLERTYKYANGKTTGRLFVQGYGLQRIPRLFRALLAKDIYIDLDMVNAHPTVLLFLCNKHNIDCPHLTYYVASRDYFIAEFCKSDNITRDIAKTAVLKAINTEYAVTKINKNKIKFTGFIDLEAELKTIQKALVRLYLAKYKYTIIGPNIPGKLTNILMTELESIILSIAIKWCADNNISVGVPVFDGLMVYSNESNQPPINELIDGLNARTTENYIKWLAKPFDCQLADRVSQLDIQQNKISLTAKYIPDIAILMLEHLLKDRVAYCDKTIYLKHDNVWLSDITEIHHQLLKLCQYHEFWVINPATEQLVNIASDLKRTEDLIKIICARIVTDYPKPDFAIQLFNKSKNIICFANGYLDFPTHSFIPYQSSTNIDTTYKLPYNLDMTSNPAVRAELFARVFYPIFSVDLTQPLETGTNLARIRLFYHIMYKLARALAGKIEDKTWFLFQGLRDSGKGCLTTLLKNAFGKYIKAVDANFFKPNPMAVQDPAKANSWIIDCIYARLAITHGFISVPGKEEYVDGNVIKKFCNGGKILCGRKNYQNEKEFKIQATLLMCCNDIPTVKPTDAYEKMCKFAMKSQFYNPAENATQITRLASFTYLPADDTIKEYIAMPAVINEFIIMIWEAYANPVPYPPEVMEREREMAGDDENDMQRVTDCFRFTGNDSDFISNASIKQVLETNRIIITVSRVKTILCDMGAIPHRTRNIRGMCKVVIN